MKMKIITTNVDIQQSLKDVTKSHEDEVNLFIKNKRVKSQNTKIQDLGSTVGLIYSVIMYE